MNAYPGGHATDIVWLFVTQQMLTESALGAQVRHLEFILEVEEKSFNNFLQTVLSQPSELKSGE